MRNVWGLLFIILTSACADFQAAKIAIEKENYEQARDNYQELSERNFEAATYELARLYAQGAFGESEKQTAIALYEKSLAAGIEKARYPLAKALLSLSDSPQDKRRGAQLILQAQQMGVSGADVALAKLKLDGQWLQQDIAGAVALLEPLSADAPDIAFMLGELYFEGVKTDRDLKKARHYLSVAHSKGMSKATLKLVRILEIIATEASLSQAERLLRNLADQGDALANYRLVGFLRNHQKGESSEIARRTKMAVDAGYSNARLRLADFYLLGEGVPVDGEKAIAIYEELSSEGNGAATARLGDIYRDGEFRPLDYEYSMQLYQQAMHQEFEPAALRIAGMLENGFGTAQDIKAALAIYQKFANNGDAFAAFKASQVMLHLTPDGQYSEVAWRLIEMAAEADHEAARLAQAEVLITPGNPRYMLSDGVEILRNMAESEVGRAHYSLAKLCEEERIECSLQQTLNHFLVAHEQQVLPATLRAAAMLSSSEPDIRDVAKAQALLRSLSERGHPEALFKLARLLETQSGDGAITPELVRMYLKSAEQGYPPAVIRHADLMLDGKGVQQNVDKAIGIYLKLSDEKLGAATYRIGKLYEFGEHRLQNDKTAIGYYELALAQGYQLSHLKLGEFKVLGRGIQADIATGLEHLLTLANKKQPKAAFALARLHHQLRTSLAQNWFDTAIYWYEEAIRLDYTDAYFQLAMLLEESFGKDSEYATLLFYQAALKGHGKSMQIIAKRRFSGVHLPANRKDGLAWAIASARLQTPDATSDLMEMIDTNATQSEIDSAWQISDLRLGRTAVPISSSQ